MGPLALPADESFPSMGDLHPRSFLFGFFAALIVLGVVIFAWRTGRLFVRLGLLVALVIFVSGTYYGWFGGPR